jgi:hypothetical protein
MPRGVVDDNGGVDSDGGNGCGVRKHLKIKSYRYHA